MSRVFSSLIIILLSIEMLSAQTIVSGTIKGSRDRPMPLANVFLSKPNVRQTLKSVEATKTGEFRITIDSKGVWLLRFSGVYHQDYTVAIYADTSKAIGLNVRLATYQYNKDFASVKLLGNFNKWYPPEAVPMQKQPDGTYAAEIKTDVSPVLYQLAGTTDGNVPGTDAGRFTYDRYHGYNAVIDAGRGRVRIVFDPKNIIRSDEPASFTFSDSVESRFAHVYDETQRWNKQYATALIKSASMQRLGEKATGFDCAGVLSAIERQLKNERSDIVRQELHLFHFIFALKGGMVDSLNSRIVLAEIPPASVVWSLEPAAISKAFDYSRYDESQRDKYVQQVIDENPSAETISFLLSNEFMRKLYGGKKEQALRYYDIAVNQYGDTPGGEEVARYHNVSAVDVGKTAPAFSAASVGDSKKIFTERLFKGKYYLMYFWATWSKPSVDEIENLHEAWNEFKGKRFAVLSLSLDSYRQVLVKHMKDRGKMPWLNAFIDGGFDSKICKDYDIYALPKPILVGPQGKVVEVGLNLRGNKLKKTLEKYLEKRR